MTEDAVVVDVIREVVESITVKQCYFDAGRTIQILKGIAMKDNSMSLKNSKYPLVAMMMPFDERRGSGLYYSTVTIPRIIISTITKSNDLVLQKYESSGTYKTVLYPVYNEFFKRLGAHPNIIGQDPDSFPHIKRDNPGQQPIGQGLTDYIDSIEILNLELILQQIKTC